MARPDFGPRYAIIGMDASGMFARKSGPEPIGPINATKDDMIAHIRGKIGDGRVLDAFKEVDRADFVPDASRQYAYVNGGIRLTENAGMSYPTMVARTTALLDLKGDERVLEVGTGSGYGAAILSRLSREVHSMEIDSELAASASVRLRNLGFDNVTVHVGNGRYGLPQAAPFDSIIVTAFAHEEDLPGLVSQLVPGGRIAIPVREDAFNQRLVAITKSVRGKTLSERVDLGPVRFLPLLERAPQA